MKNYFSGMVALIVSLFVGLHQAEAAEEGHFKYEKEMIVDAEEYMGMPIKITVNGGVIEGIYKVKNGEMTNTPLIYESGRYYSDSHMDALVEDNDFPLADNKYGLKILTNSQDVSLDIETGGESDPFDFSEYEIKDGNFITINQTGAPGETTHYSRIMLEQGRKYYFVGSVEDFSVFSPSNEVVYDNPQKVGDARRFFDTIGFEFTATETGVYNLANTKGSAAWNSFKMSVYAVDNRGLIDINYNRHSIRSSFEKSFATNFPMNAKVISTSSDAGKNDKGVVYGEVETYHQTIREIPEYYLTTDLVDRNRTSKIHDLRSGNQNSEVIYSDINSEIAVLNFRYVNSPSIGEDLNISVTNKPFQSLLGSSYQDYVKEQNAKNRNGSEMGDPIDVFRGNFVDEREILSYGGPNPLKFIISYDSIANDSVSLGSGFTHNYEKSLEIDDELANLYLSPNKKIVFRNISEEYIAQHPRSSLMSLTKTETGYQFTDGSTQYQFDSTGSIQSYTDKAGVVNQFFYSGDLLRRVENNKGQYFDFVYHDKRLIGVLDGTGRSISFAYDYDGNLTSITMPGNRKYEMSYKMIGTDAPQNLKLYELELNGNLIVRNHYNKLGAVERQEDGKRNRTLFSYDEISEPGKVIATMTDAEGHKTVKAHDVNGNVLYDIEPNGSKTTYVYDEKNRKVKEVNSRGSTTLLEYKEGIQPSKIIYPDGTIEQFEYDNLGSLIRHISQDEKSSSFTYEKGRLVQAIDKAGRVTNYSYNGFGEPTQIVIEGRSQSFQYDSRGYLISVTDGSENRTQFENDELGRPVKTILPDGSFTTTEFDDAGNAVKITDPADGVTLRKFDAFGSKIEETDPLGRVTKFEHDANGNLIKESQNERWISYQYNRINQLLSVSLNGRSDQRKTFTYYPNGLPQTSKDEDGVLSQFEYDTEGNLLKSTKGDEIATFTYDSMNRVSSEVDGEGNETTYVRDIIGRVIKEVSPSGYEVNHTYDAAGNRISTTDVNGNITNYQYDDHNNLVVIEDAFGYVTTNEYDSSDRLIATTNPLGETTRHTYNSLGQLVSVINPKGEVITRNKYDLNGNIIQATDGNGHTFEYQYDSLGNLISLKDPSGTIVEINQYNEFNELIKTEDAVGRTESWNYTDIGTLESRTDKSEEVTTYDYSTNGQLNQVIDPAGTAHKQWHSPSGRLQRVQIRGEGEDLSYLHNLNGAVIEEINPNGESRRYSYDSEGRMNVKTNARGQEVSYEYDHIGNVIRKSTPESTVEYSYDRLGRMVESKSSNETIRYTYDALGRITEKNRNGEAVKYRYDSRGHLIEMVYPSGRSVHYAYDVMGNLLRVSDWNGRVTQYDYDANDRLIKTEHANGVVETRSYDRASQLAEVKSGSAGRRITEYRFGYDANGNIVKEEDLISGEVKIYSYDILNRLIQAGTNRYEYDPYGNITAAISSKDGMEKADLFEYGLDNELKRAGNEFTELDRDGNLLTYRLNGKTYIAAYDSENRLVTYDGYSFYYDHEGNRTREVSEDKDTSFFVDTVSGKYSRILSETDAEGESREYVYGNGLIGHYDDNGSFTTYHYDYRGSTVAGTDSSGEIAGQASYDEYGVILENSIDSRFLYNGQFGVETDSTGLYFMRARYYDPAIKRFINRDVVPGTIAESQTLNRYAYTNGNPISFIDPFGLAREGGQSDHWGHYVLDGLGLIPGLGIIPDFINTAWYLAVQDYNNATLSAGAIVPVYGYAATGTKYGIKATDWVKGFEESKVIFIEKQGLDPAKIAQGTSKRGKVTDKRYRRAPFRKDVRTQVYENAKDANGKVYDPLTNIEIKPNDKWQMGHRPGYEHWKHQLSSLNRGLTRKEFLDEFNDASHYHPELPKSNQGHKNEAPPYVYNGK